MAPSKSRSIGRAGPFLAPPQPAKGAAAAGRPVRFERADVAGEFRLTNGGNSVPSRGANGGHLAVPSPFRSGACYGLTSLFAVQTRSVWSRTTVFPLQTDLV